MSIKWTKPRFYSFWWKWIFRSLRHMHCSKRAAVKLLQSYWEKTSRPRQNLRDIHYRKGDKFYTQKLGSTLQHSTKTPPTFFKKNFRIYFHVLWYENLLRHEMCWVVKMDSRWAIFKQPISISFIIAILFTLSRPLKTRSDKILLHCLCLWNSE